MRRVHGQPERVADFLALHEPWQIRDFQLPAERDAVVESGDRYGAECAVGTIKPLYCWSAPQPRSLSRSGLKRQFALQRGDLPGPGKYAPCRLVASRFQRLAGMHVQDEQVVKRALAHIAIGTAGSNG